MNNKIDYELIYAIVRQIPSGRVTSYGAIAEAIGLKKAARLVGYAMNLSHHVQPPVPAHRVVNRQGLLTGRHHFPADQSMEQLLAEEGVDVQDNKVVNFEAIYWCPMEHLGSL